MNSDIFGLISGFRIASRKLRISDSDYIDIVNHHFVPLIFCLVSIAICAKQYLVGEPIQCWVPKEYSGAWEQYAENYCWVENTYFVPSNESLKNSAKTEIQYYQWVPFVLILQGLLFYLPHYFWRMTNWISGVDIIHLMHIAIDASTSDSEKRNENMNKLVELFQESFFEHIGNKVVIKRRIYLTCCYTVTKLLYLLNLLLQFWIITKFLHINFLTYGIQILNQFRQSIFWEKTGIFPRMTFCHFEIRTIDEIHHHTLQCVLVVNMLIEKCYIAVWFLLVFLLVANCINLLNWIIWVSCKRKAVKEFSYSMFSDEIRQMVRSMKKNGDKCSDISIIAGISIRSVYSILAYEKKILKKKRGPKFKINARLSTRIKKHIKAENDRGSKVNCATIIKNLNIEVKRRTLNDWILNKEYVYKHYSQKIQLTKNDKNVRTLLCKSWLDQNIDWKKSVFTDEKAFSLDGPDNWRSYTLKGNSFGRVKRQSQGGKLMFWGAVFSNGLLYVSEVSNHFKSAEFITMLENNAMGIINLNLQPGYTFVQDNSRVHTSRLSKQFFEKTPCKLLEWPARSPDLNILENVWRMMSDIVYKDLQPKNKAELREKIHGAVRVICEENRSSIIHMFDRYRERLTNVLISGGNLIN